MREDRRTRRPTGAGALLVLVAVAGCAPRATISTRAVQAADSAVAAGLAAEDSIDPTTFPPSSVGVLPLVVATSDPALQPLGHGLAVLLTTDLARSRSLQVVDRLRVDALIRELSLAETGVLDPTRAPRSGRILGARYLVVGSVTWCPPVGFTCSRTSAGVSATWIRVATVARRPQASGSD